MPVYLFWGEDTYRLSKAVQDLHQAVLDPDWQSFNLDKIDVSSGSDSTASVMQGLNQAMTPPFGLGQRLVWLTNPLVGATADLLPEFERTLPALPSTSHLLLTQTTKPDGRSKLTKLLQKQAQVTEFALIPPWKTAQILQMVKRAVHDLDVPLTQAAGEQLAEAVGNDTRRLYGELEKLKLYSLSSSAQNKRIGLEIVQHLVSSTTQNSLQLAETIRQGQTDQALGLVAELLNLNEPGLKIVATLTRQFRTWLWVKLMVVSGEQDERIIARSAEVGNPKRIYFLKQAVQTVTCQQLRHSLSYLLDLEVALKQGEETRSTLITTVVKMSQICQSTPVVPEDRQGQRNRNL
ncbi:DNA polymerase III subunit delta [Acaryochloris marina]|uniref:DNA polymerase III subunit delta n=1 Tax=Acaryochloris marina TaxID=155978 RepID=UPI001BAE96C1|nr:DNA polymerase III subunit delta [Acaryochloris marina]QUY43063.1 DNA polymerase III subunit delta [Acaryochloris marina S15]